MKSIKNQNWCTTEDKIVRVNIPNTFDFKSRKIRCKECGRQFETYIKTDQTGKYQIEVIPRHKINKVKSPQRKKPLNSH